MSVAAISVRNLGKRYAGQTSGWAAVGAVFASRDRQQADYEHGVWSLRDVSFDVAPGEVVALIGQNGSGKSSLLKIVAGTSYPTVGEARVAGRVSAILELGMGFSPELTGRENVTHSASLMGRSAEEIAAAMPQIEDFAEIGAYFDQPVRTYSSGMHARVAFSLATAFPAEVLIIDEVLSVGDSYFQHKSFDRIRQFKANGAAILFVSHGMSDVRAICDRVVLLDKGRLLKDGATDEVVDFYNALIAAKENEKLTVEQRRDKGGWLHTRSGTGEAKIEDVALLDRETGEPVKTAIVGRPLTLKVRVRAAEAVENLVVGCMIKDRTGHIVWGTNTFHTGHMVDMLDAGRDLECAFHFDCMLGAGSYGVSVAVHEGQTHLSKNFEWVDNVEVFDVINVGAPEFIGTNYLDCKVEILNER